MNLVLLVGAAAAMTAGRSWSVWVAGGLFTILTGLNLPALLSGARALLRQRRKIAEN